MFRRNYLRGCAIAAFGFGMLVGHCVESWLLCCGGGLAILVIGFGVMRKK